MKFLGSILVLLTFSGQSYSQSTAHYLLISEHAEKFNHFLNSHLIEQQDDAALISLTDTEVESLSEFVHDYFGGCGGFSDVTHLVSRGKNLDDILTDRQLTKFLAVPKTYQLVTRKKAVAQLIVQANKTRMMNFLEQLTKFDDRSAKTANGTAAAMFLKNYTQDIGQNTSGLQIRMVKTETFPKQPSIVATLLGSKPELGHVVIGGHMDTMSSNKPGADDDASGSAVVMEVFQTIILSGAKFERTIDFIWYAAEERGLAGSEFVVQDFLDRKIPVEAVLQFDMTGYKSQKDSHDFYMITDFVNAGLTQTIKDLVATYLPKLSVGETECGYECSDHASWTAQGFPSAFPAESSFENHNPRIHTSEDTFSWVDAEHCFHFAQLAMAYLGELANVQQN